MGGAVVAEPAAGAVASLSYMILGLVALVGVIVARGLIATWTHSFGYLLEWLAGELKFSVGKGFAKVDIDLGGPFREADRLTLTALQNWEDGLEAEAAYFFHGSATLVEWTIGQVSGLADDTADAFDWLVHSFIPTFAHGVAKDFQPVAHLVRLIDSEINRLVHGVGQVIHVVEHDITHTITKVVHYAGSITLPNPWLFPRFKDWYHDILKWRLHVNLRLSRLEKLLGITGLAALITATFGAEITRFLRCKNTRGVAKSWCAADLKGLLWLIAGALAVADSFSLIGFAHYIEGGLEAGTKVVLKFWSKDVASGVNQSFGDGGQPAKRDPAFGSA